MKLLITNLSLVLLLFNAGYSLAQNTPTQNTPTQNTPAQNTPAQSTKLSADESSSSIPITQAWKTSISKDFDLNNALLQQIIIDGEMPDQIQDFAQRFEQQKRWFDNTLGATRHFSDLNYNKILYKNTQLDEITTAIKKADAILDKLELTSEQKKQIRLNLLYDINATPKPIYDEIIRQLALNVINLVCGKPVSILESNLAKIQYAQTFENLGKELLDLHITNRELLNKFEQNQKINFELNSQLAEMKKQNKEASNKINLIGELCNTQIQEQTSLLKSSVINQQIITLQEQENRQKLRLEIEILEKSR